MLYTFAHAGHTHDMGSMTMLDHCTPIIIGAGIVVAMLVAIIVYLLITWQPKVPTAAEANGTPAAKKSRKNSST